MGTQHVAGRMWILAAWMVVLLAATPGTLAQDGFQADYRVSLDQEQAEAGPQESVTFPVHIENHGDQRVRFEFELTEETRATTAQVVIPAPIELDGAQGGQPTTATARMQVFTPFQNGYVDEDQQVTFRVIPMDPENHDRRAEPRTLTVSVHTEGFYIPGPGAWTLLAVLAAVAGASRLLPGDLRGSPPKNTRSFRSRHEDS